MASEKTKSARNTSKIMIIQVCHIYITKSVNGGCFIYSFHAKLETTDARPWGENKKLKIPLKIRRGSSPCENPLRGFPWGISTERRHRGNSLWRRLLCEKLQSKPSLCHTYRAKLLCSIPTEQSFSATSLPSKASLRHPYRAKLLCSNLTEQSISVTPLQSKAPLQHSYRATLLCRRPTEGPSANR